MPQVISRDGTRIAYEQLGAGEALVFVRRCAGFPDGWGFWGHLPTLLAHHFNVIVYDRRGRGEGRRHAALRGRTRGRGHRDAHRRRRRHRGPVRRLLGAALALEAAVRLGDKVRALALYEPPYNDDDAHLWRAYER